MLIFGLDEGRICLGGCVLSGFEVWLLNEIVALLRWKSTDACSAAQSGGGSFKHRKPIGEVGSCASRIAERIH